MKTTAWGLPLGVTLAILLLMPGDVTAQVSKTVTTRVDCWSGPGGCVKQSAHDASETTHYTCFYVGEHELKSCTFQDALPRGSRIVTANVILNASQLASYATAPVELWLNDVPAGGTTVFSGAHCETSFNRLTAPVSADAINAYTLGGLNNIRFWNSAGICLEDIDVEFALEVGLTASVVSGNAQRGAISSSLPLPLRVRVQSAITELSPVGKAVTFELIAAPSGAGGAGVGADATTVGATYTTVTDGNGYAEAVLKLGSKPGEYKVRATAAETVEGQDSYSATFTAVAQQPGSIVITKQQSPPYATPAQDGTQLLQASKYYAFVLDTNGYVIGPVDANWKVTTSGKTPGAGSLDPALTAQVTTLTPSTPGWITLEAVPSDNPAHLKAAKLPIYIGAAYLDADFNFVETNPINDDWWVPGSMFDGRSLGLSGDEINQVVRLHVLTKGATSGSVTFQIAERSNYPGVAMNWPVGSQDVSADLYFKQGETRVQSLPPIPITAASSVTTADLYVNDFAAWGKIRISIVANGTSYPPFEMVVPKVKDGSKLPERWLATTQRGIEPLTFWIENPGLADGGDIDDNPKTPAAAVIDYVAQDGQVRSQTRGLIGDGFSNFQEYRGFVAQGRHIRTNPYWKDLFVVFSVQVDDRAFPMPYDDVTAQALTLARSLNLSLFVVREGEVLGSGSEMLAPVMNANRSGIPGGGPPQRAVLLRFRHPGPLLETSVYRAWIHYSGAVFYDSQGTSVLKGQLLPGDLDGHSPNRVLVAEIYPQAFAQHRIYAKAPGAFDSALKLCLEPEEMGCDVLEFGTREGQPWEYVDHGKDGNIDTICEGEDICVLELVKCDDAMVRDEVSPDQNPEVPAEAMAHELGHALNMYHLWDLTEPGPECLSIMSHTDRPAAPSFLDIERQMLRLHENF